MSSEPSKRIAILKAVEKEARRIFNSTYTLERVNKLISLDNYALKVCLESDEPGITRKLKDLSPEELEIILLLQEIREEYASKADNKGQYYSEDLEISASEIFPLGFHKAYYSRQNWAIVKKLIYLTVFPHYCITYYDLKSGKLIEKNSDDGPEVFRLSAYYNLGENSFFNVWGDKMLFMGWPDSILFDIGLLIDSAKNNRGLWAGNDMITDLFYLAKSSSGDQDSNGYYKQLDSTRKTFLEIQAEIDHKIVLSAIKDYLISIVLSKECKDNIKICADEFLKPLCQVPFGLGGYRQNLEKYYGYREHKVANLKMMDEKYQMFAIRHGLYGHDTRVIYDANKGLVTGKLLDITNFMSVLKTSDLLGDNDLRYLDECNV